MIAAPFITMIALAFLLPEIIMAILLLGFGPSFGAASIRTAFLLLRRRKGILNTAFTRIWK